MWFQSTPSLRRATKDVFIASRGKVVSIHALLAESDRPRASLRGDCRGFNPRPPCGERPDKLSTEFTTLLFQSTPSLRRATVLVPQAKVSFPGFNPRPPCGERPQPRGQTSNPVPVSIHALLAESDVYSLGRLSGLPGFNPRPPCGERHSHAANLPIQSQFQSTPSLRRATDWPLWRSKLGIVSIHALLAESDARARMLSI